MSARASLHSLVAFLLLGACAATDPNARLDASTSDFCALAVRCPAQDGFEVSAEECVDTQMMALAAFHHVFGADCVDAYLNQVDCRLDYDCYLSSYLSCPDGGVECELRYPCEELVPATETACGGFADGPDLGIGTEVH